MIKAVSLFASLLFTLIILAILSLSHLKTPNKRYTDNKMEHKISFFSVTHHQTPPKQDDALFEAMVEKKQAEDIRNIFPKKTSVAQTYTAPITKSDTYLEKIVEDESRADYVESFYEHLALDSVTNLISGYAATGNGDTIYLPDDPSIEVKILKSYPVEYPESARKFNISFTVSTKFLVSKSGTVDTVLIKSKRENFGFAAEVTNSLYKWKFRPILKDGVPVNIWMTKDFHFLPK